MTMTHGWAKLRIAAITLGLIAIGASGASASALMNYSTSGSIDTSTGVTGSGVISFDSVQHNTFSSPSSFSLGQFVVANLPSGQTTTYANTPFSITFLVNSVDGSTPSPNQTPVVVTGELNGSITGANQSNVQASFDPIKGSTFLTGLLSNTLSIPNSPLSLVPSTTNGGKTSAQAFLVNSGSTPVPEPTSVALFLTALGLGLRHRVRRASKLS